MAYGASRLVIDLFRLLLGNASGSISATENETISSHINNTIMK